MTLMSLSRSQRAELEKLGATTEALDELETMVAKKAIVLLEEMKSRGRSTENLNRVLSEEQRTLARSIPDYFVQIVPFTAGHWKSTYVRFFRIPFKKIEVE